MYNKPVEMKDRSNAIMLPPFIYLGGFFVGLALHFFFPQYIVAQPIASILGAIFVTISIPIIVLSMRGLSSAGTAIDVRKPTTAIVASGMYRFSRNPIYLAMMFLYVGVALLLNSLTALVMLLPVLMVMHFGVIAREEKYLEQKFGDEYVRYKKSVRRWI